MLNQRHFAGTLQAIAETLPFGKQVGAAGLLLAWQTIPAQAKRELTDAQWTYAAGQYVLDPERPREMPVFLALLRYLYRCENGQPNYAWGLKPDLAERMARPDVFHPQPAAPYLQGEPDQPSGDTVAIEGLNRLFQLPEGA